MNFWRTSASPNWLHTWERILVPSYLRYTSAIEPRLQGYEPVRALSNHGKDLTEFWNLFYRGKDWRMDLTEDHVKSYLDDKRVLVYILVEHNRIVASIVSTPCPLVMSHGASLSNARIIEGLVVHPYLRNKGIAGLMIAYMDYITSKLGPVCHLWAREELMPSFFSTAISSKPYSYILPENILQGTMPIERLAWSDFIQLKQWSRTSGHWIRSATLFQRRGDLDVWWGQTKPHVIVVVANTRRIETKTNKPIHEIVWCSDIPQEGLLESIALKYKGPLFTTLPPRILSPEWTKGKSGYHSWYIYNYLPPAFGNCTVELIREEL